MTSIFGSPRRIRTLGLTVVLSLASAWCRAQNPGPFFNGVFPRSTPGVVHQWQLAPAFQPRFDNVMDIDAVPRSTRLCVASRDGILATFDTTAGTAAKTTLADLSRVVARVHDGGFMGVAFHPEFGASGSANAEFVYFFYCANDTGTYPTAPTQGFYDCYLRLSRYRVPAGTWSIDPASEQRLLNLRLYNATHRGGDIAFGPDGFLYVPIGEQYRYETAQDIAANLEGGILRIDVDRDPIRSHAPRRALPRTEPDEVSGVGYWIPNANPFLDPGGGVFEEYFTLGHRNPHKIAFDPITGELWGGEVGDASREEINRLTAGGNYGWPFREGELPGPRNAPTTIVGTLTEPLAAFDRGEATAIIGGKFSHTTRLPSLHGKYLCGDYISGRIWAIAHDPISGVTQKQLLLQLPSAGVSAFGQGPDGEVYVGLLFNDQPLFRLDRLSQATNDPPPRLSNLGVFKNLKTLDPAPGFVPFEPAHPFWSDHAEKYRWIAVPAVAGQPATQVRMSQSGDWQLPPGSVVMKHFDLPLDRSGPRPHSVRRVETRFLVVGDDGNPYGLTYKWLGDGSDAILLTDAATEAYTVQTRGGPVQQIWEYPSRAQCLTCHNPATGGFLGIRTHQLNTELRYPQRNTDGGVVRNQIEHWGALGWLHPPPDGEALAALPVAAAVDDEDAPLELRARAYLDANCAACHRPGTAVRAAFDARFTTPLWGQNIVTATVQENLGILDARAIAPGAPQRSIIVHRLASTGAVGMPPLGRHVVDTNGLQLLTQWVNGLPSNGSPRTLGNGLARLPQLDTWHHTLVVNKTDTYTNTSGLPESVSLEAFRFYASQIAGHLTPFVVTVQGPLQFTVVAIGTSRGADELHAGFNAVPFAKGPTPTITLGVGETIAIGFMDARPDGSGGAPGGIIPYCTCNRGDDLWITGSTTATGSGQLLLGAAPAQGAQLLYDSREYAFAIDTVIRR